MTPAREIRLGARNSDQKPSRMSVERREIGRATPRPVDDQELLLHEEAVGDNRSCTTGSQELGDRGQQMCQEDEQILHGEIG